MTKATHNEVFTTFIREASLAILRRVSLTLRVVDRRDEATSSWGVWHVRPEGLVQDKERRARFNAVFEEPGEARG